LLVLAPNTIALAGAPVIIVFAVDPWTPTSKIPPEPFCDWATNTAYPVPVSLATIFILAALNWAFPPVNSNFWAGAVVPIPIFPLASSKICPPVFWIINLSFGEVTLVSEPLAINSIKSLSFVANQGPILNTALAPAIWTKLVAADPVGVAVNIPILVPLSNICDVVKVEELAHLVI
jgi:hypothetical protein